MRITEITRLGDKTLFTFKDVPEAKIVFKKEMSYRNLLKFLNYSKADIKRIDRYYKMIGINNHIKRIVTYCQFIPLDKEVYKDSEVKEGYFE